MPKEPRIPPKNYGASSQTLFVPVESHAEIPYSEQLCSRPRQTQDPPHQVEGKPARFMHCCLPQVLSDGSAEMITGRHRCHSATFIPMNSPLTTAETTSTFLMSTVLPHSRPVRMLPHALLVDGRHILWPVKSVRLGRVDSEVLPIPATPLVTESLHGTRLTHLTSWRISTA